jgi:rod shape-determining protein MreD
VYKIKRVQIYLIILLSVLLQTGPLNSFKLWGVKPDIILICVVFFGLFLGPGAGLESGALAGLLKDIFSLDFFWVNTLIMAAAGLMAGIVSDKFSRESKKAIFTVVLFFTLFSMSMRYILVIFLYQNPVLSYTGYLFSSILPASVYTGVLSIPLYVTFVNVYHLKEPEEYI